MVLTNALFCPKQPSYSQIIIPLSIILTTLILTVCILQGTQDQLALREICLDHNLPADCSDSIATNAASKYGTFVNGFPGIIALFTVGFWTSISNKIGRRWLLMLSTFGFLCPAIAWYCSYYFKSIHPSWQYITIAGNCIQATFGGVFILYLAVFATVNDVSIRHPEKRIYYYLGVDLLIAICSVVATQLSTFFMGRDPLIMCTTCCIGYISTIILTYLLLPETIDNELQQKSIEWNQMNPFKQLQFIIPTNKQTQEILAADVEKVYNKIVMIYKQQNPDWIEPNDASILPIDCYHHVPTQTNAFAQSEQIQPLLHESGTIHTLHSSDDDVQHIFPISSSILEDVNMVKNSNDGINCTVTNINGPEIPPLGLPFPPRKIHHKNGFLILLLSLCFNTFVNMSSNVIQFLYMKETFATSSKQYNDLNAYSVGAKTIISFVILPLFNKFVTSARGEINVLITTSILEAALYCLYPFTTAYWQYAVIAVTTSIIAIFPTATIRSLMSNQVTEELQKAVLATLVTTQVGILLLASVSSMMLWTYTAKYFTGIVYICAGVLSVIAAIIVPLFLQDTRDELNLRVKMTTQYTRICHLEDEYEKKLQLQQEEEKNNVGLESIHVVNN